MVRAWLFQANPSRFDIDRFAASRVGEVEWLVSRYADKISPGDRVFLWRSEGREKEAAGVFAEAEVISDVRDLPDDGPPNLWADPSEATLIRPRVRLSIKRFANKKEVIKRDWWKADPILRDHLIMRMANSTTFPLEEPHLSRLSMLWAKTGGDWTYAEAVAGLHVFTQTLGQEVSLLPKSPVAITSLLIGRPIKGVYNKVMNFRSLDPSDPRKGMDGASEQDRVVWSKFYEPGKGLRFNDVSTEFERLWPANSALVDESFTRTNLEAEAERLATSLTLDELLARWKSRARRAPRKPRVTVGQSRLYERDPLISAIARKRAAFRCEAPNCQTPTFPHRDGMPFVEVHHIEMLSAGGDDTPENVVCLCPNHHREAHFGGRADALAALFREIRSNSVTLTPGLTERLGAHG